jgi:pseudouridine kinase
MPIVIVGNVFVDFKGFPEGAFIPAGRNAGRVEIVHGGVGRNVAEDIANVELRPRFVSMVDNTAQDEFAAAAPNVTMHRIDDAKHEILNGTEAQRKEFFGEIFKFLVAHEEL